MKSISLIVLTRGDADIVERCLKSVKGVVSQIIVVIDSRGTDGTPEVAKEFGAEVFIRPFKNQADQFNWALDNLEIKGDWILKLDDDEYLTPELKDEISKIPPEIPLDINGFYVKRRVYFMGRWIKHGGYYPMWFLRLWRKGKGRSEDKEMDEHIVLSEGKSARLRNDFVDDSRQDLSLWTRKHDEYSSNEANEFLKGDVDFGGKRNFYYKLPPFFRVFVYFFYRYFLRLGFLDGKAGLTFHFLQGFWYRFLIDAKIYELNKKNR